MVNSLTILTWFCSLTAFKILISLKAFDMPEIYSEEQNKSFFLNFSLKWRMITNNLQCDICVLTCIGKPCPWGSISNLNFFSATLSPVSFIVALKTTPKVPLPTTFSISIPRSDRMSVGKTLVKKRSALRTASEHQLNCGLNFFCKIAQMKSQNLPTSDDFAFFKSLLSPSELPFSLFRLMMTAFTTLQLEIRTQAVFRDYQWSSSYRFSRQIIWYWMMKKPAKAMLITTFSTQYYVMSMRRSWRFKV